MAVSIQAVDLDQLESLGLRSFRCTPGPGDAPAVEAAIRGLTGDGLRDIGALVVAAVDGHHTVGVGVANPLVRPGAWNIPLLAVRTSWQGRGLGRQIKARCLDEIRAAGGERAVSSVHAETEAMHRINRAIPGARWENESDSPGVVYSVDLTL